MLKIDNTLHCIIHGILMEPSSFLCFAETEQRLRYDISMALFFFKGVVQNFGASVLQFYHWRPFQHVSSSPSNSAEPPGATPVQVNSFCWLLRTPTSTHHSKKWINIRQLVQESRTADCCAFAEAGEDSTSRCQNPKSRVCFRRNFSIWWPAAQSFIWNVRGGEVGV